MQEYEKAPQLLSLKCSPVVHLRSTSKPSDGISLLPSSLGESEKEAAERASVVVRFWPSSRSRHVSEHLKALLLFSEPNSLTNLTRAQEKSLRHMGPRRKPWASLQAHIWPNILTRIHYSIGAAQLSRTPIIITRILSYQYKYLPAATQDSDTKTLWSLLLLRYLRWIAWSQRFMNPTTLSDHSHVLNIETLIYQCGLLWIVANLCMTIPIIKRHDLGGYKEIITCELCSNVDPKYPHAWRKLRRVENIFFIGKRG